MSTLDLVFKIVTAFGVIGTFTGVWFAYRALTANHDWQRRQYAMGIVSSWNDITADHARAIERAFPHIRDIDRSGKINEITRERAKEIYTCDPDNADFWELRFNIVELLNHLEFVITAYSQHVADRRIIEIAFRGPLMKWHDILRNFLDVVEQCEGYQPWESFVAQIAAWRTVPVEKRKPTA